MRKVLFIGLTLVLLAGCNKLRGNKSTTSAPVAISVTLSNTANNGQPSVHAPTGVVIDYKQGGGSGGAAQAVRKAVVRVGTENELRNIQIFIYNAAAGGRLPTIQQIKDVLQKEDKKAYDLVQDGTIQLTGANNYTTIWAFTQHPQRGSKHAVANSAGIEWLETDELLKRLNGQQGQ